MEIAALLREDDASATVVAVAIVAATTIVVVAAVGVFALGLGAGLTDPAPDVDFAFEWTLEEEPGERSSLTIRHEGGERFDQFDVEVTVDGETAYAEGQARSPYHVRQRWSPQVRQDDVLELQDDGDTMERGDRVEVVWSSGEHTATIGSATLE